MTIFLHELRQGKVSLAIWTASIALLLMICVFLFPEMKDQMDSVSEMFASMGSFSAAFGMDRVNFGELTGFYSVECGNIIGLGGAFFSALCGISSLAKEESSHTAEFLLTHPVSRMRILTAKLCSVIFQITVLNLIVWGLSILSMMAIGEEIPWKDINLMHLAFYLMQLEIAGICFGFSAFLRRGGLGVGLGMAILMYFLNIIANISDSAEFLKYITPFGYTEGADILTEGCLDTKLAALGMLYGIIFIMIGYVKYLKKDIQ